METNAIQAIEIGASIVVFIMALSCSLLLLNTVLNMSEAANEVIKSSAGSTLIETYGGTNERIYTGNEVYATINEYESEVSNVKNSVILKISDGVGALEEDVSSVEFTIDDFKAEYNLVYRGQDAVENKKIYTFVKR